MMPPDSAASDANRYRIQRLEQDVHDLQVKLDDYGALKQTVGNLDRQVSKLADEFTTMRRALYTAALTVGGSAIIVAVSILVAIAQ
jgi:conjugal transfer/entry exclusion protein